jgi:two-component system, OmpR family, sensor histidine kinase KdpD
LDTADAHDEVNVALDRLIEWVQAESDIATRLRVLNAWKDTVIAAARHDARSPIATVRSTGQTLLNRGDALSTAERMQLRRIVVHQSGKAIRLLDELFDLDRVVAGTGEPRRTQVAVDDLVRTVTREIEMQGRHLTTEVTATHARIDAVLFDRVVENLLRNTVAHTPAGTRVALGVHPLSGGVEVIVDDDGPGVPADVRETAFELFVHAATGPDDAGGSGIGLAVVSMAAQLHGGTARIGDSPLGGARFVVELPGA